MKKDKAVSPKQPGPPPECGDVWLCVNYKTDMAMIGATCNLPPGHAPPHTAARRGPLNYGRRAAVIIKWGLLNDTGDGWAK